MLKQPCLYEVETFGPFDRYLIMTFLIEAKKDERDASTIRALVPDALQVAQKWVDSGWTVSITCPEGGRYWPNQFDLLLWKYAEGSKVPRYSVAELSDRNQKTARGIDTPMNAKLSK